MRKPDRILALLIAGAVFALYARTAGFGYVFDDASFIVSNPGLALGLTGKGVHWAFTATHHANWHPLAWLAHLADRAVFGAAAGPAHLVNAGLHAACAALLFLVLRRLTGAPWPSALAAAAFALHPLRVESVAWVTERKDALSTIFWILALGAYLRYARRPGIRPYLLVAFLFALGLMTKAMVVTLPGALLLLDWWPLGRIRAQASGGVPFSRLLLEKLPLLLLSSGAAAAAILSQRTVGAVQTLEVYSLPTRLANALVASVAYLRDTLWPANLAVYYPHPGTGLPPWQILASALILAFLTAGALWAARKVPALATGWLWYLVTLLPVIGLVQVGAQARADRYTYLPSIGLLIACAWGIERIARSLPRRSTLLAAAALAVLGTLAAASWRQIGWWSDDVTLFTRALAVTKGNWLAENNLGLALSNGGEIPAGMAHFHEALRIRPSYEAPRFNLGVALARLGRTGEAVEEYRKALVINPDFAEARLNLGVILADRGFRAAAIEHYRAGLRGRPDLAVLHMNLGNALSDEGDFAEALEHYAEALRLDPKDADVHANRGVTHAQMGNATAAAKDYAEALRIDPDNAIALRGLGHAAPAAR